MGEKKAVIIGGGPAGLAAAYYLSQNKVPAVVLEKDKVLGGLSRTVEYKGFRFDIGPHRFFTKSPEVKALWQGLMGPDFLHIPRQTRIFYKGRLFHYPLKPANALFGLGVARSIRILASLVHSKLFPIKPERSFEDWVSNRFGRELYRIFFKTYTEKVWGMPCTKISADWAAQRIRNLSLAKALMQAVGLVGKGKVASLVDEFNYPRLGPGQLYQRMAEKAKDGGARVLMGREAARIFVEGDKVTAVEAEGGKDGERFELDALFSSMPLTELAQKIYPEAPPEVMAAARSLRYRSMVTVNFILKRKESFGDNWIYIHSPEVSAGRLQFYRNWGPSMAPDGGMSSVGLEYFCFEGDDVWNAPDGELVELGRRDLMKLGIEDESGAYDGFVMRYAKAYPVYEEGYESKLELIRRFVGGFRNLYTVGRYGQFRYNNMDHSIMTSWLAVRKMLGENVDPWSVNADAEYHEEKAAGGA